MSALPTHAGRRRAIGEVETEIWEGGSGDTLVFLHGGDGVSPSVPFLERLARHFRVIAPSHPGFDDTARPAWCDTVDDIAYFHLDLLKQLDVRDAVLAGAGFGGWVAAEIAVRNTGRLRVLALIDAVGAKFGPPDVREIVDLFSLTHEEQQAYLYTVPPDARLETIEQARRVARNRESLSLYGWSPTLHNPKLAQRLRRIDVPTLVLWGEQDRVVPVSYGRRFAAAIPGAAFQVVTQAGHYAHIEQPDAVVDRLLAFATAQ